MSVRPARSRVRQVIHEVAFGSSGFARKHRGWWNSRNVVGLAYARKVRRGKLEEPCLQVLVRQKRGPSRVADTQRIPSRINAGFAGLRSLRTDVLEVGSFRPERLASEKRPAHPGFDVGDVDTSGTLTCVVRDASSGQRLGLSCAHVIASDGAGEPGDAVLCPSGPMAQVLGVMVRARIGALTRVGLLSPKEEDASANIDAAVFAPDEPGFLSATIAILGRPPRGIRNQVFLGLPVIKVGAVSGKTTGDITLLDLVAHLDYQGADGPITVPMQELIGISSFAVPGDSGALVLDTSFTAVGVHIGSYQGMSVCIPMRRVLGAMDCTLE